MKKLFVAALLAVTATSAFAQDIKSVLKAKDYAEAQSGLNSCLSSLNDEDKAKGYNKLVDLSFDKFNKENAVAVEAQTLEQMGQKSNKTYDKQGTLFSTVLTTLSSATSTTSSPTLRARWLLSSARRTQAASGLTASSLLSLVRTACRATTRP